MIRYVIRREFYGALIYDKEEDCCIAIDDDFYEYLVKRQGANCKSEGILDAETEALLLEECLIEEAGIPNYRIVRNEFQGETLSSPPRIHFYYTANCNLNCAHCFSKRHTYEDEEELTFAEKVDVLDQMYELGISEILIGGGEPFIEPDFLSFVDECLKRDIVTKVFTNGLLITPDNIRHMSGWNLKYLSISIDGATEEEYLRTRGSYGIDKIADTINMIHAYCSFPIAISITVNAYNFRNAIAYLEMAKRVGADRIKIRPTKPSGNVHSNSSVYLSAESYVSFIKTMQVEWLKKYSDVYTLDYSWGDARLYYDKNNNSMNVVNIPFPYEGYGCFAGKASMVIDSRGFAVPCGFLPDAMQYDRNDNVRSKSLKEIWDTGKKFNALRNMSGNTTCLECEYYGVCRGGCIARILFEKLPLTAVDPWCLRKHFPIYLN